LLLRLSTDGVDDADVTARMWSGWNKFRPLAPFVTAKDTRLTYSIQYKKLYIIWERNVTCDTLVVCELVKSFKLVSVCLMTHNSCCAVIFATVLQQNCH